VIQVLKAYYHLAKPGIIYGNSINTSAGLLFAANGRLPIALLLKTVVGIGLVIGSACVFNNYIDRDIDKRMPRTKKRALVTGAIGTRPALIYGAILGLLGFGTLYYYTNLLTVSLGILGYVDYLIFYAIGKRNSVHGTLIGSISGATPIVAGYTAVTNDIDTAAVLLFVLLVCWQMAHFFAIAMYRHQDYKAAGIPVLPVVRGHNAAKLQITIYITLFAIVCGLLTITGYTGFVFIAVMIGASMWWLWQGFKLWSAEPAVWGKKMFGYSLVITLVQAVMLVTGRLLP
jgi:protoheme IX farnesyltransferase